MSTLAYAALTSKREEAKPGFSATTSPPGVKGYVDALAALVPAEVLALHGLIVSYTTRTRKDEAGNPVTIITDPGTLRWSFLGLILVSVVLYVVPRTRAWDRLDFVRMTIPAAAFVAWTMLQRATAFDAVCAQCGNAARTSVALFGAVLIGMLATHLAYRADRKSPPEKRRKA